MADEIYFDGVRYVSANEAASAADLTRDYVARLCRDGKVRGRRVGKNWYVDHKSLIAFIVEQEYSKSLRQEELAKERASEYRRETPPVKESVSVPKPVAAIPMTVAPILKKSSSRANDIRATLASAVVASESARKAKHLLHAPTGISDAALAGAHMQFHLQTPLVEFVHKLVALTLAFALTFGTYSMVDPRYARFAVAEMAGTRDALRQASEEIAIALKSGKLPENSSLATGASVTREALVAATATGFTGAFEAIARTWNTSVDAFLFAIVFPQNRMATIGGNERASVAVRVVSYVPAGATSTRQVTPAFAAVVPSYSASVPMPGQASVIERILETRTLVQGSGITEAQLDVRLAALADDLNNRLATITSANSTQSVNIYQSISNPGYSGGSGSGVSDASELTGTLGIAHGGTGQTSTPAYGELLVGNGSGGFGLVSTSSLGISGSGTVTSVAAGNGLSGGTITTTGSLSLNLGNANTWTALQQFANASSSRFSAGVAYFGESATSSFNAAGTLFLAGGYNGPLHANAGVISATSSIGVVYGGTGLTGAPSYGQVLVGNSSGGYTLTSTSSLGIVGGGGGTSNFGQTFEIVSGAYLAPTTTLGVIVSASSTIGGGTQGSGLTISGGATTTGYLVVQGNSTSTFAAGIQTTALNVTGATSTFANGIQLAGGCFRMPDGSCAGTGAGSVTSVNASGGTTGLTFSGGPITSSGTLTLSGILGVGNGGTGWGNIQSGALVYGNGTGAIATTTQGTGGQVLAWLSGVPTWTATTTYSGALTYSAGNVTIQNGAIGNALLANSSLTVSAGAGLSGGGSVSLGGSTSLSLDLASANTWTALQKFANASSTLLSVFNKAFFGGTATTTIDSAGNLVVAGSFTGTSATTTSLFTNTLSASGASFGSSATSSFGADGTLTLAQALSVVSGGTGRSSLSGGQVLFGNGTGAIGSVATGTVSAGAGIALDSSNRSILGGNLQISFSAPVNSALSIPYASSTAISSGYASSTSGFFGTLNIGTLTGVLKAASGVVSAALVNLATEVSGILPVPNGGTGWANIQSGALVYGNGTGAVATTTQGTGGQVLAWLNGVPTWAATTTLATISGTLIETKGGTNQTAYATGDILYASGPDTLARLAVGGAGTVLKVAGGVPTWGTDIQSGGGGGATAFSTTTDNLAIYPTDTSDVFIIGAGATTTANSIFEVFGRSYFSNVVGIATTSPGTILSIGNVANFASNGSTLYSSLTLGNFISTSSALFAGATSTSFFANTLTASAARFGATATSSFSSTGALSVPGSSGIIITDDGAAGAQLLKIGDDAFFTDTDNGNTLGLYGQGDATVGYLQLGSGGGLLTGYSGRIGIGEYTPGSTLAVSGNGTFGSGYDTTAAPANGLLVEGNVGIGTTTPGAKLGIQGNIFLAGNIVATSTLASQFLYASTTALSASVLCISTDCRSAWPTAGASFGQAWEINGAGFLAPTTTLAVYLGQASSTLLSANWAKFGATASSTFGTNGSLSMGGHLTFGTDNTFDIGASGANRARNLFLAGSATLGGDITTLGAAVFSSGALAVTFAGYSVSYDSAVIGWANSGAVTTGSSPDSGLARVAAGVVEINNGSKGTLAALRLSQASSTNISNIGRAYFGATATTTIDSAGNVLVAGTLGVTGNTTLAQATSSNLAITSIASGSLLKTTTGGAVIAAVAGTDYLTGANTFGKAWEINAGGFLAPTTTLTVYLGQASSTLFSANYAKIGGTASTTIDTAGNVAVGNNLNVTGQTMLGYASSTGITASYASSTSGFFGNLSVGALSGFLKATAGAIATAAINLATDITGILAVGNGGTGWAAIQAGAIPYGNGSSALATTTAGTPGQVLALLGGVPTWTATTTFGTGLTYNGGIVSNAGVTTIQVNGPLTKDNPVGSVTLSINQSSASSDGYLSSTDWNLFNNKVSSSSLDTYATGVKDWKVAFGALVPTTTLGILVSASSTIGNGTQAGGLTISGGATTTGNQYIAGTLSAGASSLSSLSLTSALTVANGGTGATTLGGGQVLFGNGTGAIGSVATGTVSGTNGITVTAGRSVLGGALAIDCTVASGSAAGCLSSADWTTFNSKASFGFPFTSFTTFSTTTSATSSSIYTAGAFFASSTVAASQFPYASSTAITATNAFIGTLTLTNDLTVANGGTGASTLTGLLQGNGTGAFTALTDSSTVGQILRVTGSNTYAWGALDLSDTDAITGILPVANGGTGWAAIQSGGIVYGNGTGAVATTTQGTGGQILAWLGGIPTWTATTTFSSGLAYSAGNVTNTGVLAVGPLNQTTNGTATLATSTTGTDFTITGSGSTITFNLPTASASNRGLLSTSDWTTFNNKQATISASWPITLSGATLGFNGLSTSTAAVIGNIPYFSGANTFANVATTSVTAGTALSFGGTAGALIGGSNLTINFAAPATSALSIPYASTTMVTMVTASTTNLYVSGAPGGFLKTSSAGLVATSLISLTADISGTLPVGNGGTGATTLGGGQVLFGNGTGAIGSVATGTVSGTNGITVTAGRSVLGGALAIDCTVASGSAAGCLSSADWTTFNSKASFGFPFTSFTTFSTTTSATSSSIYTAGAFFASSTVAASQFPYASTTAITATTASSSILYVSGAPSGFLKTNTAGLVATSLISLTSDIAGTLSVGNGGTGATNIGKLQLLATDSSGNVISTSTPTAAVFNATSTTATSTFGGGFKAADNFVVLQNGTVGLGTGAPSGLLDVRIPSGESIYLGDSNVISTVQFTNGQLISNSGAFRITGVARNGATDPITLEPGSFGELLRLTTDGKIGINDTSPDFRFESVGSVSSGYFGITNSSDGDIFKIDGSGWVGIGTTTPGAKLGIQGDIFLAGNIVATSTLASQFLYASTTAITATTASTTNLIVSSAGGSGTTCAQFSAAGLLSSTGSACASGGSSFGKAWEVNSAGFLAPTTTLSVYLGQASSTLLSANWAKFGGIASTTIDTSGNVDISQYSSYKQAGASILYASTTNNGVVVGPNSGAGIFNIAGATHNTVVGSGSLTGGSLTGDRNNVFGAAAGLALTSGSKNQLIGVGAGASLTEGWDNIVIGDDAGYYNATGNANVYIGQSAGRGNSGQNQSSNVGVGYRALFGISSGGSNAVLGNQAGYAITSGSNNVLLGAFGTGGVTSGSNNILIGQDVQVGLTTTGSNQLNIGNLLFGTGLGTVTSLSTGNLGVATSTPTWTLNPFSSTASQLALSAGADIAQWAFRNAGGNLYLATTTVAGTATSSQAALSIAGGGFGTTTVIGLNITGQATSTSNVGFNITTGCFAINGTCVGGAGGGGSGTVSSGLAGQFAFYNTAGTTVSGTSTLYVAQNTNVGVGTTTPWGKFSINNWTSDIPGQPLFVIASSTASATSTLFIVGNNGNVGIGTTTPFRLLSLTGAVTTAQQAIAYDSTRWTDFYTNATGDFTLDPQGGDITLPDENLWVCSGGACPAGTPAGTGNVVVETRLGVGTSTPQWTAQMVGTRPVLGISDSSAGTNLQHWLLTSQGGNLYAATSSDAYATTSISALTLNSKGWLGLGTTSPTQQFAAAGLLYIGSNAASSMGTATSTFQGDVKINGKLDVSTIDPPYTIDGVKYATYVPSMTGVKEETTAVLQLDTYNRATGKYEAVIKFDELEEGSDMWLFYQIVTFGENWKELAVLLTPAFDGQVFYKKNVAANTLTISGTEEGEVSMRLTAARYDRDTWPNLRPDQDGVTEGTHVISSKDPVGIRGAAASAMQAVTSWLKQ